MGKSATRKRILTARIRFREEIRWKLATNAMCARAQYNISVADNTDSNSSRIKAPPAPELIATAYARELGDAAILYQGMSLADLARAIMLVETDIIPHEAGGR